MVTSSAWQPERARAPHSWSHIVLVGCVVAGTVVFARADGASTWKAVATPAVTAAPSVGVPWNAAPIDLGTLGYSEREFFFFDAVPVAGTPTTIRSPTSRAGRTERTVIFRGIEPWPPIPRNLGGARYTTPIHVWDTANAIGRSVSRSFVRACRARAASTSEAQECLRTRRASGFRRPRGQRWSARRDTPRSPCRAARTRRR